MKISKQLLETEIINFQEDVSLQMYKRVGVEEFWAKHVPKKYQKCKKTSYQFGHNVWFYTHNYEKHLFQR